MNSVEDDHYFNCTECNKKIIGDGWICDKCEEEVYGFLKEPIIKSVYIRDENRVFECTNCGKESKSEGFMCSECCGEITNDEAENEEVLFCGECKEEIKDFSWTCDKCEENFCCVEEIEEYSKCTVPNCYYCKSGYCNYNNLSLGRFCSDCAPESLIEENKPKKYDYDEACRKFLESQAHNTSQNRKKELVKALSEMKLELRSDSKLCKKYIDTGDYDINYVVERMCQMKYLYEYCDFKKMLDAVSEDYNDDYENLGVFDKAEKLVLEEIGDYPDIYPWMNKACTYKDFHLREPRKLLNKENNIIQNMKLANKILQCDEITPKCNLCDLQANVLVNFECDNSCNDCETNIDKENNIYLCKINCKGLYYDSELGYCKIKNNEVRASLLCEKDDCYNCGSRIMYMVKTYGVQIKKFHSETSSYKKSNIKV